MCSDLPLPSLHMKCSEESIHSLGLGPHLLCTEFGDGFWTLLGEILLTILMDGNWKNTDVKHYLQMFHIICCACSSCRCVDTVLYLLTKLMSDPLINHFMLLGAGWTLLYAICYYCIVQALWFAYDWLQITDSDS